VRQSTYAPSVKDYISQARRLQHLPAVHLKRRAGMKLKLLTAALIASGLTLYGCASHRDSTASAGESRSASQFTSDAALTAKVKAALAKDAGLGTAADINVQSYRGVVQLNGFVNSDQQIRSAQEVASRIEGVNKVENNLRVKPAS
jgi:osmotically-inducible protein OsmY